MEFSFGYPWKQGDKFGRPVKDKHLWGMKVSTTSPGLKFKLGRVTSDLYRALVHVGHHVMVVSRRSKSS